MKVLKPSVLIICLCLVNSEWLTSRNSENHNLLVANKLFHVELVSMTGAPEFETVLSVQDKTTGLSQKVLLNELFTRFQTIEKLILVPGNKVCVQGHLPRGGRIISVIDLNSLSLIDTLWINRELSFSPSYKYLVYLSYAPNFTPRDFSPIVLLYDFTKSPSENRISDNNSVENGGFPIFPTENLTTRSYDPLLAGGGIGYTSPFLWSEDENKIVFLYVQTEQINKARRRKNYLTSADFSRGILLPEIIKKEINIEEFIDVSKQASDIAATIENKTFPLWANDLEWIGEGILKLDISNTAIYGHDNLILNVP